MGEGGRCAARGIVTVTSNLEEPHQPVSTGASSGSARSWKIVGAWSGGDGHDKSSVSRMSVRISGGGGDEVGH